MIGCHHTRSRISATRLTLVLLAALLIASISFTTHPSLAYAKSYAMTKVDIEAHVDTNASLHVVEQRTFDFSGSFTAVWWTFSRLPQNANLEVNTISLMDADGTKRRLGEVSFEDSWRDAGGPGRDAYSIDKTQDTVYVFFSASDEQLTVIFDYTVVNAVQAYEDTAELYWKFITEQWEEASQNVTMTLTLPVPTGTAVTPGENVRAWGHGPFDGTLAFNDDGSILYQVKRVNGGAFAETRVLFDVAWLTDLDESARSHRGYYRLEAALREEQAWADQANQERVLSLVFVTACVLISLLALLWAIWSYFKHGKEHAPEFTDQYWRDIPSQQDHPAVIARLWRWGKKDHDDLSATLMHLSHIGVIKISKGSYIKKGILGKPKPFDDYYMTRIRTEEHKLTHPIDYMALSLLFDTVAEGADSLWFGSIEEYGKKHPEEFSAALNTWHDRVSEEVDQRGFLEKKGQSLKRTMHILVIVLFFIGIAVTFVFENFVPMLFAVLTCIIMFLISYKMPRRSPEGSTLYAKCKALSHWLEDFSLLNERPPTDIIVWGELMVYAFIFGIARRVIEALRVRVPEVFKDQDGSMVDSTYTPWWFWYGSAHGVSGNAMPSVSDMFKTSLDNTLQTISSATLGALGHFSGGGGGGGGFSGGGGGGFGGGGGAR